MSEQTPTPEQIAAVEWLRAVTGWGDEHFPDYARTILESLDPALTNPRALLPTEPGAYHDAAGTLTILDPLGEWRGVYGELINPMLCPTPFTRLAPAPPQVTVQEVQDAITNIVRSRSFSTSRLLADLHVEDLAIKLHATIVNGTDR